MKSFKHQQGFTSIELIMSMVILLAIIGHGLNIYLLQQAYQVQEWVEVAIRVVAFVAFPVGWILGYVPF